MGSIEILVTLVLVAGSIGVVVELPKILTHHINQPVDRKRRERAARRKLAVLAGAFLLGTGLIYLAATGRLF